MGQFIRAKKLWSERRWRPGLADLVYLGLLLSVVVVQVAINRQAENSLPTPWPDEAHFLWQSHAVAENNTLFAEELNTDRTIMWQPPAYLVAVGLLFKLFGSSLALARLFSLLLLILAFGLFLKFASHYGHRWYVLAISTLFFLGSRFVAAGNVARMETMLLVLILGGFLLIQRARPLLGLALLAITPLVHFNGFYFALAGLGLVTFRGELRTLLKDLKREEIAALITVGLLWASYALLIAFNFDSFLHDMDYQLNRKAGRQLLPWFHERENLLLLCFIGVGLVAAVKSKLKAVELLFLAAPAWLIWPMGREMWYEVIDHLGYLLISLFMLHLWLYFLPAEGTWLKRSGRIGATLVLLALLLGWNFRAGRLPNPFDYYQSLDWSSMNIKTESDYFTPDDHLRVSKIIDSLRAGQPEYMIEFQPHADGLFFVEQESGGIVISCPVFQPRKPDLQIVHLSSHLPRWWSYGDAALKRAGLTRDSVDYILYSRDSTEQWYFGVMDRGQ